MKKILCVFLIVVLFCMSVVFSCAESVMGRSAQYILSNIDDDLAGNVYGWYVGNPEDSVVIMVGLGNEQGAYDNNAIPVYTDDFWSDKNVYWFSAEVNGRSGSIHDGFSKEDLDKLIQAHYANVKDVFPNAHVFVVGGYSAGGWAISSLIDVVLENGDVLAAVFGLDCVPKNSVYDAFVQSVTNAGSIGVPVFIGASSSGTRKNSIEKRTAKFATDYADVIEFYSSYKCKHGDLCNQFDLVEDLTYFVDTFIKKACVSINTSVIASDNSPNTDQISINNSDDRSGMAHGYVSIEPESVQTIALKGVTAGRNHTYIFEFNAFNSNGSVVNVWSVTLSEKDIKSLVECDEVDEESLLKCGEYYVNVFNSKY